MKLPNKPPQQNQGKQLSGYARYSGLVFQMMAIIGIGVFIGFKLDQRYPNKHQLFTTFLSLFSVIAAIVYIVKRIIAISKEE